MAIRLALLFAVFISPARDAAAQLSSITGTVKSADEYSVTIVGREEVTLEVTPNSDVRLDGRKSSMLKIEPGVKATVFYKEGRVATLRATSKGSAPQKSLAQAGPSAEDSAPDDEPVGGRKGAARPTKQEKAGKKVRGVNRVQK